MLQFALDFDANEAKRWEENGAQVIKLVPTEQAEFMRRARAATEQFIAAQPELQSMYKHLTDVAAKHRKK